MQHTGNGGPGCPRNGAHGDGCATGSEAPAVTYCRGGKDCQKLWQPIHWAHKLVNVDGNKEAYSVMFGEMPAIPTAAHRQDVAMVYFEDALMDRPYHAVALASVD